MKTSDCPILLVEDDDNDVYFFRRALQKAHIDSPLQVAEDGQRAEDLLAAHVTSSDRAQPRPPALVVLDLNLPRKTGLQVLKWIRERAEFDAVPVVILTSSCSDHDMKEAYHLGANSYLIKPSDPDTLVEMTKLIAAYWIDLNQSPPCEPL